MLEEEEEAEAEADCTDCTTKPSNPRLSKLGPATPRLWAAPTPTPHHAFVASLHVALV
jgi:hypothetical protein